MLNFIELTPEERKKVIKYLTEKDYKNSKVKKPSATECIKTLGKNNFSFSEFRAYINQNVVKYGDPMCKYFYGMLDNKINNKIKIHSEVEKIINESEYADLSNEVKQKLDNFKDEYEKSDFPLNFDRYILFNCVTPQKAVDDLVKNKKDEIIDKQNAEIESLQSNISKIEADYNSLIKEDKRIKEENQKYKAKCDRLLSIDNVTGKISELLETKEFGKSDKELFKYLSQLENNLVDNKDFEKVKKILAAKYALLKMMEEGK